MQRQALASMREDVKKLDDKAWHVTRMLHIGGRWQLSTAPTCSRGVHGSDSD